MTITITVSVAADGFFTNAQYGDSFVCTTIQPTLEMSLASAMPEIRQMAEQAHLTATADAREINELECMAEEAAMIARYDQRQAELYGQEFWHGPAYNMTKAGVCTGPRRPWESDYTSVVVAVVFAIIAIACFSQV